MKEANEIILMARYILYTNEQDVFEFDFSDFIEFSGTIERPKGIPQITQKADLEQLYRDIYDLGFDLIETIAKG